MQPTFAQDKSIRPNFENHDWLRGSGDDLEMRLRGKVKSMAPADIRDFNVSAALMDNDNRAWFTAKTSDGSFEVWLPVNSVRWYGVELIASTPNGHQALAFLHRNELRKAAMDGLELELSEPDVIKTIVVSRDGVRIANVNVRAVTDEAREIRAVTGADGSAKIGLKANETLGVLTAWSCDKFIGGYQFWRLPKRDPNAQEHAIDLIPCRSHLINTVDVQGAAIPNIKLSLHAVTPENSISAPDELAVSTDGMGHAEYKWFPKIANADHIVQLKGDEWLIADQKKGEGQMSLVLKPAANRMRIEGKVTNQQGLTGGLSVQMESFQSGIPNRSDIIRATADRNGRFFADVLPNAFYSAVVNDSQWVSEPVDFMPFSEADKKFNEPELFVTKGFPVQIVVTSGIKRRPLAGIKLSIGLEHPINWVENGKFQFGNVNGRRLYEMTNKDGVVEILAQEGKLEVYASKDDWQSKELIVVLGDLANRLEIHREVDEFIEVVGQLVAPKGMAMDLSRVVVKFGAIDGKSTDKGDTESIALGRFKFKTKASRIGIYASSKDGLASGTTVVSELSKPVILQLHPKQSFSERLLTAEGEVLKNQKVLARIRIVGETRNGDLVPASFDADQFHATTNENGEYTFSSLPCSTPIELIVEPIYQFNTSQQYLGSVSLRSDGRPPGGVSQFWRLKKSQNLAKLPSLSERFGKLEEDCRSKGFHLMIIVRDPANEKSLQWVNNLLSTKEEAKLDSYLWLQIDSEEIGKSENAPIVRSLDWPSVESGNVFLCTYDPKGREIGRIMLDITSTTLAEQIREFVKRQKPAQLK